MAAAVPGFSGNGPVLAGELSPAERDRLESAIADRGIDYVGQELVRLSTTPVWEQGRITPRPFVLRVFAAATPQWLDHPARRLLPDRRAARCPRRLDGRRRAVGRRLGGLRQGGFGLDAAAGRRTVRIRRIAGVVPSRAADNLFWLGRYLERAEATLRLIRALGAPMRDPVKGSSTALHSVERIQRLLVTWGATSQATRTQPAQGRRRGAAERGKIRLGAVAGAIGAAHRDLAARTAVARRLAGHHRDGGASRPGGRRRRRRRQRRRTDAAGTGELRRPGAGEHEPRRRLALPRHGPPRRARHQHRAVRAAIRL